MLDLKALRSDSDAARTALARRGDVASDAVDDVLALDAERRGATERSERLRAQQKQDARGIAAGQKAGEDMSAAIVAARVVSEEVKALTARAAELDRDLHDALAALPNLPDPTAAATDEIVREVGEAWVPAFGARDHLALAGSRVDMERGARVSGSRFAYLRGDLVFLELALVQWTLTELRGHGFEAVIPPVLVREDALFGTGFLPDTEQQIYHLPADDLYLAGTSEVALASMRAAGGRENALDQEVSEIDAELAAALAALPNIPDRDAAPEDDLFLTGTAEVPLASLHADVILDPGELPLRYAGFSTCFRREAGAAGRDTRGIFRVHQFDKVEMFSFVAPADSEAEHQRILAIEERILAALELPYRVVDIAVGDLGAPAARKFDCEAWIPSQGRYRELTSCSNTTDYQARRLGARFRPEGEAPPQVLHTLNGTAVAVGRTLVALIENGQRADGSVELPAALVEAGAPASIPA